MTYNETFSSFHKRVVGKLDKILKDKQLSQSKLDEIGLDSRYIRRIKSGEVNFTLKTLWNICHKIDIDPESLFKKR